MSELSTKFFGKVIAFLLITASVLMGIGGFAELRFFEVLSIICFSLAGITFIVWLFKKFFLD